MMTEEHNSVAVQDRIELGGNEFLVSRPHAFGLVVHRPLTQPCDDYLHAMLLTPENRSEFLALIQHEGLVVCKDVETAHASYRRVRGKSSFGKLSQAEYYHHDGCSCPTKPQVVEIRLPHQQVGRGVATAIAPFPDVLRAMLMAIPDGLLTDQMLIDFRLAFANLPSRGSGTEIDWSIYPSVDLWDHLQGRVTRLIRRELDAESAREYFRQVDRLANAYDLPWEMGESRLMLNSADGDLCTTMQHRRAYQRPRQSQEKNGSLVKRWTAEEY